DVVDQLARDRDVVITSRLGMITPGQRVVLAPGNKTDLVDEACCGVCVQQTQPMTGSTELLAGITHVARRYESKCEQKRLYIPRELLASRTPVGIAMVSVAVGLEQPAYERRVDLAIVGVKDCVRNVSRPPLAAVSLVGRKLGEPASIPPNRQRYR